jgi:hypothetical protein
LLECRVVVNDQGPEGRALQPALDATIDRACATLVDRVHHDGCPSLLFGGGLHAGHPSALILAAAQRLCGVRSVSRPSIVLDQAGVCGWRDGRSCFLFACGPVGDGCDAHADALAFEWTVHGERLFVAGGGVEPFALEGERRLRARFRRTRLQVLPDGLVAEGECDRFSGATGRPLHRRLLRSTHDGLRVEDRVEGGAGQATSALLTCHPLARAKLMPDGTVTIRRGAVLVRVEARHPITIEAAVWQPDEGLALATQRLVVRIGPAPCVGSIHVRAQVTRALERTALATGSSR